MRGGGGGEIGGRGTGGDDSYNRQVCTSIDHGACRHPMATMGLHSQLLSIQQSANILSNRSTSLKLEETIINNVYRYNALTNCCACLSPVLIVVPLMQSIGGNDDGTCTLYMFPLMRRALGLACQPCSGPWQLKFGEY